MSVYLLALALSALASHAAAEQTVAGAGSDLGFVFLLHRHGDRGPISPDTNIAASLFSQQWPLGCGELTGHGMRQLFDLGSTLRTRYVGAGATNANFLPAQFDASLHYTRSTDLHRTLQSAQSLLYAMYLNAGPVDNLTNSSLPGRYQPMPVSTVVKFTDYLLVGWDYGALCVC